MDDSTGMGDWTSSRLEFWTPVHLLACAVLLSALAWSVVRRDWALAGFCGFGLVLIGAKAYVGTTLWLRRNRGNDKWRDPW